MSRGSPGSSPTSWQTDEVTDEIHKGYKEYLKTATSREADRAAQEGAGRKAYHHLGGEVEARNAEKRTRMSNEERKERLLTETEWPLYNLLDRHDELSRDDISKYLGWGRAKTAAAINRLIQKKLIQKVSIRRSVRYRTRTKALKFEPGWNSEVPSVFSRHRDRHLQQRQG